MSGPTITKLEQEAREAYEAAVAKLDEQDSRIQGLPDNIDDSEREFHQALFDTLQADVDRTKQTWERQVAIAAARRAIPPVSDTSTSTTSQEGKLTNVSINVREPLTYRLDNMRDTSFFRDLYYGYKGDSHASERLRRHAVDTRREMMADVSTADPGAGVFVPPAYLADLWADYPRNGRPFADAVPKMPLTASGMNVTIPRLTTATTVASQSAEAAAPSETDADGTLLTVPLVTIAGQQDLSIQAFERTDPSFDAVVFRDLRGAYDAELDRQLLHGAASGGEHRGLDQVASRTTTTWTQATPTVAGLLGQVYSTISAVSVARTSDPDLIVMHTRRGAWAASSLSASFPLFPVGAVSPLSGAGIQRNGFLENFAGLRVVLDRNVVSTAGAGTNQDKIFVLSSQDLILMEGPIRARVLEQTLANTLQVKLQLFAYSIWIAGRYPSAIGEITGTGLVAPTFAS